MSYYVPLYQRNITVDFAHPESELSNYKLVIAPNLYLVKDPAIENVTRYVENGGNLIMSFFSGIVDGNEHILLGGYPAPFREILGLVVEEFVPYSDAQSNTMRTTDGARFQCTFWSDIIHLKGAVALAEFERDYYAGSPAITSNKYGKGTAYYVGTVPDAGSMEWLLELACETAGIQPVSANAPGGVELLYRTTGSSLFLFALNHSAEKVTVSFEGPGQDLLTGTQVDGSIQLEPTGVAIVQLK